MKLLMENWKKFLLEDKVPGNEEVIAYHRSPNRFEKFDMAMADPDSHSGVGLFFAEHLKQLPMHFGKYIYKVKLKLGDGIEYPKLADGVNFQYNYVEDIDTVPDPDFDEEDEVRNLVYKMLNHDDIEILDVTTNAKKYLKEGDVIQGPWASPLNTAVKEFQEIVGYEPHDDEDIDSHFDFDAAVDANMIKDFVYWLENPKPKWKEWDGDKYDPMLRALRAVNYQNVGLDQLGEIHMWVDKWQDELAPLVTDWR